VTGAVQAAAIRRRIRILLRLADDYSTTATVVSFTGLTDAQQHVALELGRPAAAPTTLVRLHSECLTGDVFGSQRWTAGGNCAKRSSGSPSTAGTCCICARKGAAPTV
jgi:GTP cyclohydrolase II